MTTTAVFEIQFMDFLFHGKVMLCFEDIELFIFETVQSTSDIMTT